MNTLFRGAQTTCASEIMSIYMRATKNLFCQLWDVERLLIWTCNKSLQHLQVNPTGNSWRKTKKSKVNTCCNYNINKWIESSIFTMMLVTEDRARWHAILADSPIVIPCDQWSGNGMSECREYNRGIGIATFVSPWAYLIYGACPHICWNQSLLDGFYVKYFDVCIHFSWSFPGRKFMMDWHRSVCIHNEAQ